MQQPTDAQLHVGILAGDETAIGAWHARIAPRIRGWLRVKGIPDQDAEEIFDDVFISTVAHAARITPIGSGLTRYIFRAASNQIAEYYEGLKTRVGTLPLQERDTDADEAQSSSHADPVAQAAVAQLAPSEPRLSPRAQLVLECLEEVAPGVRRVAELVMERLPEEEIAARLHIAPVSVRQYLRRMRLAFMDCLGQKGMR